MIRTLNKALEVLGNGKSYEAKAWDIAKKDKGLNKNVTKDQWLAFAKTALLNRK